MVRALIVPMIGKHRTANETIKYFPSDIVAEIFPERWTRSVGPLPSLRMLRKIDEFEPEVVFTDTPFYSAWYVKFHNMLRRKQIRLVSRLQGDPWSEYQIEISRILANPRSVPLFEAFYILLRNPYIYFLLMRGLEMSDRIITVSHWQKERIQLHLNRKFTEVIPLAIDPVCFYEDGEFDYKHPNVGLLQNMLVPLKIDGLLAFRSVTKQLSDVHFYIGGGGPLFSQVKHNYKNLKNVHFLGPVKNVRRFYASINVYAHASGLDCCPISVMEASFMGKPVLGSKVGGIPEIIADGLTGWSIRNRDTDQWVNKISLLLQDEKLAKRMGRAGRARVEEHFTWEVVSKQIAKTLTDVVENS